MIWQIGFTTIFLHLGVEFSNDDYIGLPKELAFFIQIFRNSIGDITTPNDKKWCMDDSSSGGDGRICNSLVVYLMWLIFLLNQFIVLIILLNFLIAIVGSSHEQVMSRTAEYTYRNINSLNNEWYQIKE